MASTGLTVSLFLGFFPSEFYPAIFLGMGFTRFEAFLISLVIASANTCLFCFSTSWLIHVVGDKKIHALVIKFQEGDYLDNYKDERPGLKVKIKMFCLRLLAWLVHFFTAMIVYLRGRGVLLFCLAVILAGFLPVMMKFGLALIVLTMSLEKVPFLILGISGKLLVVTYVSDNVITGITTLLKSLFS
jgi:hypothetical protein